MDTDERGSDYYERIEKENAEIVGCMCWLVVAGVIVTVVMIIGSWVLTVAGKMF
jgi:hypothetical protein